VRNYFSGRERWRLLALVVVLGLVIVFMRRLRQPETVEHLQGWLTAGGAPAAAEAPPASPDAFRAIAIAQQSPVAQQTVAPPRNYYPGVRPQLLSAVRDNTYFRTDEAPAWFHLLSILQTASEESLQAASTGDVGYVELAQQPSAYRARLVTVRGAVRQVTVEQPADNDLGLTSYYRLVIQPAGGDIWPIFAYVLELPADFPQGTDVSASVSVTGFFFKDLSYAWHGGLGIAPVLLAKTVLGPTAGAAPAPQPSGEVRVPVAADQWTAETQAKVPPASKAGGPTLRELLALAGWNAARWAEFRDGQQLSADDQLKLLPLLRRLDSFDSFSLARWARGGPDWNTLVGRPAEHRAAVVSLAGRVRRIERHALAPADAARLEMPAYFECELQLDGNAGTATILTSRVPRAWLQTAQLDEPVSASALFIRMLPEVDGQPAALLLSPRLAWHPTEARPPAVSFGNAVLGTLGMDVGALDDIRNRDKILPTEREAFYELLDAMNHIGANQLIRFAQDNLPAERNRWAAEAESLASAGEATPSQGDRQRRLLANEALRQLAAGHYSVAPLFNDPDHEVGQLLVLDGVVRRAVRVDVGTAPDGRPSDVRERFGIDHYYELELFTDDSQNYPVVVCVPALPAGFPTGDEIHAPVRVAGFFFKTWLYHTRKVPDEAANGNASGPAAQRQFAPLVIGPTPLWIEQEPAAGNPYTGLVGSGLFVLAMVGMWAAAWWYAREDRRFRDRVLALNYALPEGRSLDDLHAAAGDGPPNVVAREGQDTSTDE
jgi:hypothetical protein